MRRYHHHHLLVGCAMALLCALTRGHPLPAVRVSQLAYNHSAAEWLLRVHFAPPERANVTGLLLDTPYFSRPGLPPYSQGAYESFYAAQHPCLRTPT
eukprot:2166406-Rhodomonas_salina.1